MMKKYYFDLHGMSCQSCANRIEKVLKKKKEIQTAEVQFASESLYIHCHPTLKEEQIIQWIQDIGFDASIKTESKKNIQPISYSLIILLSIASLFMIDMIYMMFFQDHILTHTIQWILATIAQILGWHFYKKAYQSIKSKSPSMDVLVVLGTSTIWLYSSYFYFMHTHATHHLYFEGGVMILAFVSLGKYLEQRTKYQGINAIHALIDLQPKTVLCQINQEWVEKPIDSIKVNHLLKSNQGQRIACDGIVIEGKAYINTSHLTGESELLYVSSGSQILTGSIIEQGSLIYQCQATGSNTQLGEMIRLIEKAQSTKAPISRFADKVSAYFVPLIILIALLTGIASFLYLNDTEQAIMRMVSVLVIACPCSLGLATPASIMVGMGESAKQGILFKNAESLENCHQINYLVLDKTGTLTKGEPSLQHLYIHDTTTIETIYPWIYHLETYSAHPISRAFKPLKALNIQIQNNPLCQNISQLPSFNTQEIVHIEEKIGQGILAQLKNDNTLFIGRLQEKNSAIQGDIQIGVYFNNQCIAILGFSDPIREETPQVITALQKKHIQCHILSGDQTNIVKNIAEKLHIQHYDGEQTPSQKATKVQTLINQKYIVGMVGDGVNDAPALQLANISFAVYEGLDITKESADILLSKNGLYSIYQAYTLSNQVIKNIKQNLFFSFFYNILGVPIAAMGLLNPMIAGLAMSMSSLTVLFNALRLKYILKKIRTFIFCYNEKIM